MASGKQLAVERPSGILGLLTAEPHATWLLEGHKTIETREYAPHPAFVDGGSVYLVLSGPGGVKQGAGPEELDANQQFQLAGSITFTESFQYSSREEWEGDFALHRVPANDASYGWSDAVPKHGWRVTKAKRFEPPIPVFGRAEAILRSMIRILPPGLEPLPGGSVRDSLESNL